MVITELKPLILNLSDDDVSEEEEGGDLNPSSPLGGEGDPEVGVSKSGGIGAGEDGFDLDSDLIENPGEEEF
jgi:hypothetical protein